MSRQALAQAVLDKVGGPANVTSLTSCFTRLRFVLKDPSKVQRADLEQLDGVISVVNAGGQVQVVIGSDVLQVREQLEALLPRQDSEEAAPAPETANLFDRFVNLISAIFQPILWVLAGTGLLKAFILVASSFGWLASTSTTYVILSASADALFYFLPMFLAFTAAKRFGANQFVSLTLAGGLLYPSIIGLASAEAPVTFFGIPVVMATYTSSVIPIVVIVWVQSHAERWLKKVLPGMVVNFLSPALIVLILFPLSLMTIGPLTTYLGQAITNAVGWIYTVSPVAAGFVIGGLAQFLVVFGLHWAMIAVIINEFGTSGQSFTILPFYAGVTAQTGAVLAVFLRTRNAKLKQVAGPAALSGLLSGISEPAVYGVNLPLRRPFIIGLGSAAVGGAVIAASGVVSHAFAVPSLISMPAALGSGDFTVFVIGVVGAMVLAFVLTYLFGVKEPAAGLPVAGGVTATPAVAAAVRTSRILAPMAGSTRTLSEISDQVFASGSMGKGVALLPADGQLFAPADGVVIACLPHAYGIRTDDGIEVLVHVGIDTIKLEGEYFRPAVQAGDRVTAGDAIGTVDLKALTAAGYDSTTVVLVTNSAMLSRVERTTHVDVSPGDVLLEVTR
ncbi:MAG: PTS glucose transporter subunit IIA [Propionibacteriaceae bacterium]|nr:PTS glucose transporter subunit IIA [Propionibacteriaceae bacterium]